MAQLHPVTVAALVVVLAGCGDRPFELNISLYLSADAAAVPGVEGVLDGQVVNGSLTRRNVSVVHDSYQAAKLAPPIPLELVQDGGIVESRSIVAGSEQWCGCDATEHVAYEDLMFVIFEDAGRAYLLLSSHHCRTGETSGLLCIH